METAGTSMKTSALIWMAGAIFFSASYCSADFIQAQGTGLNPNSWVYQAWGDFDNDGLLDILEHGSLVPPLGPWQHYQTLYRNEGNEHFLEVPFPVGGTSAFSVNFPYATDNLWVDDNRDGNLDIVARKYTYLNNGNGVFTKSSNAFPTLISFISWGDYDNDGDPDAVVSYLVSLHNWSTRIFRNDGNGVMTALNSPSIDIEDGDAAWFDMDNDGYLDLVVSGWDAHAGGHTRLYRNNTNGTFTQMNNTGLPDLGWTPSISVGDYDGDGYLDIAMLGATVDEYPYTGILRNNQNGTFTDIGANLVQYILGSLAFGDYNNDGKLDIAVIGNYHNPGQPIVYQNQGHDIFTGLPYPLKPCEFDDKPFLCWVDYDNDGRLDLSYSGLEAGPGAFNTLYRNIGDPMQPAFFNKRPAAPTLATQYGTQFSGTVTLQWNPVTTDETPAAAMTYNLRVGTSPGACDVVSADADSSHPTNNTLLGNVQNGTFAKLKVPAGNIAPKQYYWAVQAVDGGYRSSEWSRESMFVRPPKGAPIAKPTPGGATSTR